jgi:hypothetical protein
MFAALPMSAGTIDVSAETSALVRNGNTLAFELGTWNFGVNAAAFGLPQYPSDINFALVSAPLSVTGDFSATLSSANGTVSVDFGSLSFGTGYIQGSEYTGAVATVQGYLHLSSLLSEELFGGGSAVLTFRNDGADVTVGSMPWVLGQDLYASLSVGPLSVGAIPGTVTLDPPDKPENLLSSAGPSTLASETELPEPRSGTLLLGGGVLLFGLSRILALISRRQR